MVATRPRDSTPAPPPSDAGGDDLAAVIVEAIHREIQPYLNRIGTISSISGGNAQVSVQGWDEDASGQQLRARVAGTNYAPGDTVLMTPVGRGEYVVAGKIANATADRAVVGPAEVQPGAIRRQHILGGEVTPALLDRQYATPAEAAQTANQQASAVFDNRITPYATTTFVTNQIATRQPAGNYVTANQLGTAVGAAMDDGQKHNHLHESNQVSISGGSTGVTTGLLYLAAAVRCAYQNRNNSGNPCRGQIDNLGRISG